MAITTNTEYKVWAKITSSADDALITSMISAATAYAQKWCGRVFESGSATEYHNGQGNNVLLLKNTPVTAIASVKLMDSAGTAIRTLATTDYKYDSATGELRLTPEKGGIHFGSPADSDDFWIGSGLGSIGDGPAFGDEFRNVQVIYTGGEAAPDDVKMMIWRMVDAMRGAAGQDPSIKSEKLGDYGITYADGGAGSSLDAAFQSILAMYRAGGL